MNKKGFTIFELLTVISIITVISLVSLPLFFNYKKNVKLKNEAKLLATNLKYAQQLAVTEQVIHMVVLSQINNNYQLIKSEPEQIIKTVSLDPEVTFFNVATSTFRFNATGAALETGQIILINTRNATATVEIKPSGYVQIIE